MDAIHPRDVVAAFKNELVSLRLGRADRLPFLAGVMRGAGEMRITAGTLQVALGSTYYPLMRLCDDLTRRLGMPGQMMRRESDSTLRTAPVYELLFDAPASRTLLDALGLTGGAEGLPGCVDPTHTAVFLRGLALVAGTVTLPSRNLGRPDPDAGRGYAGYLAELKVEDADAARPVVEALASFGLPAKTRPRPHGGWTVYLQGGEALCDYMTALGAQQTMFLLQEFLLQRSVSNGINRRNNCAVANLDKSMQAAATQLEAIAVLEEQGVLPTLDAKLQDTARLRRLHPDAPLARLSALSDPPVGKSGLNHRLNRLVRLAEPWLQAAPDPLLLPQDSPAWEEPPGDPPPSD